MCSRSRKFQKQKASGALPTEFPTIEEKDDLHRIMMEVEPLLGALKADQKSFD